MYGAKCPCYERLRIRAQGAIVAHGNGQASPVTAKAGAPLKGRVRVPGDDRPGRVGDVPEEDLLARDGAEPHAREERVGLDTVPRSEGARHARSG